MGTKQTKQTKIFVSHTGADKAIATALVESLASALNVKQEDHFYFSSDDSMSIKYGDNIVKNVVESLRDDSACVIALLTKQSYKKPWLQFEAGGAFVKSRLVSVFLPGCPPKEDINEFFTYGKYINLRTMETSQLKEVYSAVAEYFQVNVADKSEHQNKFVSLFLNKARNLFAEQVAAVCVRKLDSDKEPKILLIKNKKANTKGQEISGNRRHFPKNKIQFGDHVMHPETVAVLTPYIEAGVIVTPDSELLTFKHFKSEENREIDVTAYLVNYFDESKLETSSNKLRQPKWFSQNQALKEVAANRVKQYAQEYQKVIKLAFAAWTTRNTK